MGENEEYSVQSLEECSYRDLQQIAKSLSLPCNIKKVYLVQLIYAKKNLTDNVVENIIQRVKLERQLMSTSQQALRKKSRNSHMHLQGTEVSSTLMSPPITSTPKRPSILVRCKSPALRNYSLKRTSPIRQSDRVLRSFNVKTYRRPNYSIMNSMFGIGSEEDPPPPRVSAPPPPPLRSAQGAARRGTAPAAAPAARYRPSLLAASLLNTHTAQNLTFTGSQHTTLNHKTQTYSVPTRDAATNYNYIKSVGFRRKDGKISKINALVQKSKNSYILETPSSQSSYKTNISIQDIINTSIESRRKSLSTSGSTLPDFSLESARSFLECNESMSLVKDDEKHSKITVYDLTEEEIMEVDSSAPTDLSKLTQNRQKEQPEISDYPQIIEQEMSQSPDNYKIKNNEVSSTICDTVDGSIPPKVTECYTNYPSHTKLTETITYQRPQFLNLPESYNNNIPAGITDVLNHNNIEMETDLNETLTGSYSVHTHKERREEARGRCGKEIEGECLPHINDAFTRFQNFTDVNKPMYVQANYDKGRYPSFMATSPAEALETLYNLRTDWILMRDGNHNIQISPLDDRTKVVFSTNLIATAKWLLHFCHEFIDRVSVHTGADTRDTPHRRRTAQVAAPAPAPALAPAPAPATRPPSLSTTESCIEYQDLGATVTIPEMMEDALEIVSQDGDYMERLSMDERMQCVLCDWAGPKFILGIHIKKEHAEKIHHQTTGEWNVTFRLGTLYGQAVWLSSVMELHESLYVLSVKYDDPDCLMAALTTLTPDMAPKRGSITVYNKVNGEPFCWEGVIEEIPTNMPYENHSNCLKLQISMLDLLPNSANLKLLNRQLVLTSPTKTIVGRPELDNIQVIFFVKVSD